MNGLTPAILKNIPSNLKAVVPINNQVVGNALNTVKNVAASFPLESAAKPMIKAAPVTLPGIPDKKQSTTLPGIPKKKPSDDLPDRGKNNRSIKENFEGFDLGISFGSSVIPELSEIDDYIPRTDIQLTLYTPYGLKLGPIDFSSSLIFALQSQHYDTWYGNHEKDWTYTGIGGLFEFGGILFFEGHFGYKILERKQIFEENWYYYQDEITYNDEYMSYGGFMGISSEWLTKRMGLPFDHVLIGQKLDYNPEEAIYTGTEIRMVFKSDKVIDYLSK